jgi:hypothetical protein
VSRPNISVCLAKALVQGSRRVMVFLSSVGQYVKAAADLQSTWRISRMVGKPIPLNGEESLTCFGWQTHRAR